MKNNENRNLIEKEYLKYAANCSHSLIKNKASTIRSHAEKGIKNKSNVGKFDPIGDTVVQINNFDVSKIGFNSLQKYTI